MTTATKGDFDNKIGSHTMHEREIFSARHQLFYVMFFAGHLIDQTLACLKSTLQTSILKRKRRSRSVSRTDRIARETPAGSTGGLYHDGMGDVDTLPAASLHVQNKLNIVSRKNGFEYYTGGLEDVDVIREHQSIIEEAERKTATTWVVATAATQHATGNRDLLSGLTPDQPGRFVLSADGAAPMQVVAHGCVITNTVVLPNVLYVPGLTANLVSASQLVELNYTLEFSRGACHIRSAADGTIVGKASVVGESGLFELDFLKVLPSINMRVL